MRLARAALFLIPALGCSSVTFKGLPPGAVVGLYNDYNYSPSIIQTGGLRQFWWCASGRNPNDPYQVSDTIKYESINLKTKETIGPLTVLGETPGTWDSVYTCNPKVVRGTFQDPLGDGKTYSYAMYYVATASGAGLDNSIGVAFSNDGILWNKYPQPVILSTSQTSYGVGQPAVYNSDHQQAIWIFYEDDVPVPHHIKTISTDGIQFSPQGTLTSNGLDPNNPNPLWGDMAFDPQTGYWYAAYNLPWRARSTTGGVIEYGQYGFQVYRIQDSSVLSGATPWEELMIVDTNLTGYESNFIPGFLRDMYGNVNVGSSYPSIQIFTSISDPAPPWNATPAQAASSGFLTHWNIGSTMWVPNQPAFALNQYFNGKIHEATTGWIDPSGHFQVQSILGHLYPTPQQGATVPFYGCKRGSMDYFVTTDPECEGQHIQGLNGYGYPGPNSDLKLVALYLCSSGYDHFLSPDSGCEGKTLENLIGYVLP